MTDIMGANGSVENGKTRIRCLSPTKNYKTKSYENYDGGYLSKEENRNNQDEVEEDDEEQDEENSLSTKEVCNMCKERLKQDAKEYGKTILNKVQDKYDEKVLSKPKNKVKSSYNERKTFRNERSETVFPDGKHISTYPTKGVKYYLKNAEYNIQEAFDSLFGKN